jgi:hypothetical protein
MENCLQCGVVVVCYLLQVNCVLYSMYWCICPELTNFCSHSFVSSVYLLTRKYKISEYIHQEKPSAGICRKCIQGGDSLHPFIFVYQSLLFLFLTFCQNFCSGLCCRSYRNSKYIPHTCTRSMEIV